MRRVDDQHSAEYSTEDVFREAPRSKETSTVQQFVKLKQPPTGCSSSRTHNSRQVASSKHLVRTRREFNRREKRQLTALSADFTQWCANRLGVDPKLCSSSLRFPKPSADDWIMRVSGEQIEMNTYLVAECTLEAFLVICLHELAHVRVQGVPNKIDARQIKESYGDRVMVMFDIEADILVAEFLRSRSGIAITDMLGIYYDTGAVFADAQIRVSKLERFLGTVFTLVNAWVVDPAVGERMSPVIVPSTTTLLTDELLHLMEVRGSFKQMRHVPMALEEFATVRRCYVRSGVSRSEFVQQMLSIACRILTRTAH